MLMVLREVETLTDEGQSIWLEECKIETDTTSMRDSRQTIYRKQFFRERGLGMRARRAEEIEPGVFRFDDGQIVRAIG